MTSIYKEAFVEAKKLREVAMKNAQNAVIESISPTIKEYIDKILINEDCSNDLDDENILLGSLGVDSGMPQAQPPVAQNMMVGMGVGEEPALSLPDADGKITLDIDRLNLMNDDSEIELTRESIKALAGMIGAGSEQFGLRTLALSEKLNKLRESTTKNDLSYFERLKQIKVEAENVYFDLSESVKAGSVSEEVKLFIENNLERVYCNVKEEYVPRSLAIIKEDCLQLVKKATKFSQIHENYQLNEGAEKIFGVQLVNLLKETLNIYEGINELISETKDNHSLLGFSKHIRGLFKEIYQMAKKNKTLSEAELKLILHGLSDDVSAEDLSVEVMPADGMGGDADMGMGGDDMSLDLSAGDEGVPEQPMGDDMGDDMGMGDSMEDDDMDLEEMDVAVDLDMPGDMEVEPDQVQARVSPVDDEGDMDMGMDDDEVVEISEADLRREISRLRGGKLNEESDCDVHSEPHSFDGRDHGPENEEDFGGGKSIGEPFVDIDHLSLSESEDDDEEDDEKESLKESVRDLKEKVESFKKTALTYKKKFEEARTQLAESDLFNAKLVYANKLLQNENLNDKQKDAIINALDEAESVKEVKKLFATMNEALAGRKQNKLTEGAKVVGTSSKAQKSGGTSQSLVTEADKKEFGRWSELAGIMND